MKSKRGLSQLAAARRAHDLLERKRAGRDPLVLSVLEAFPGAEVVDVYVRAPAPSREGRKKANARRRRKRVPMEWPAGSVRANQTAILKWLERCGHKVDYS